jgi:hypothetical protein
VKKNKNGLYSFAFVEFDTAEESANAIRELDQFEIYGKRMRVYSFNYSDARTDKARAVFTARKLVISQGSALKIDRLLRRAMVNAGNLAEKEKIGAGTIGVERIGGGTIGVERIGAGTIGVEMIGMNGTNGEAMTIDRSVVVSEVSETTTNVDVVVPVLLLVRSLVPVPTLLTSDVAGTVLSLVR